MATGAWLIKFFTYIICSKFYFYYLDMDTALEDYVDSDTPPILPPLASTPAMPPPQLPAATQDGPPPKTTDEESRRRAASESSISSSCSSGHLPKAYFNIRAARPSGRTVRIPGGCAAKQYDSVGSLAENDDFYNVHGNYRHNYTARQNICTSFTLKDFNGNTCTGGEHVALHREGDRIVASDLSPAAIVLSDQNFPAAVPVEGEGECLKVIGDMSFWLDTTFTGRDIQDTRTLHTSTYTTSTGDSPLASSNTIDSPLASVGGTASPLAAVTYHLSMPANLKNKDRMTFEMSHSVKEKNLTNLKTRGRGNGGARGRGPCGHFRGGNRTEQNSRPQELALLVILSDVSRKV
jgi:hypothetical protein